MCNAALYDILGTCSTQSRDLAESYLSGCAEPLPSPAAVLEEARALRANWIQVITRLFYPNLGRGCNATSCVLPSRSVSGGVTNCAEFPSTYRGVEYVSEDACRDACESLPMCTQCSEGDDGTCAGGVSLETLSCDDTATKDTDPRCCERWRGCANTTSNYANCKCTAIT